MIANIDAAEKRVHLAFCIWLTDNNGLKMAESPQTRRRTHSGLPGLGRWHWLTLHELKQKNVLTTVDEAEAL